MTADPRPALATLVAAFERHLDACATRRGENDPAVVSAYQHLADAFDSYDDALMDAYGEVTPLDIYNGPFEDDEEDDDEDDGDADENDLQDELDEDDDDADDADDDATVVDDHDDEDGNSGVYLGLDDSDYDVSQAGEEQGRLTPPRRV